MRAWKEGLDFHALILADKEITSRVPRKQIERAFDLARQLKNVDKIFVRVFGKGRGNTETKPTSKSPRVRRGR
jgi:adenylosuccinate lyase